MSLPKPLSTDRTFYIAGAGIAGLTLALALAKFGATVIVLERNAAVSEFGAGLQISPNARRVLSMLGLDKDLRAKSLEPEGIDVYPYGRKKPLVTLALGQTVQQRYGDPYLVMHRADLVEVLYKACRRFANIDIVFNVRAWDAVSHARGASVTADEISGQGRSGRAFAVVGADGVHSFTRTSLLEGAAAKYTGVAAWRALVPIDDLKSVLATDRTSLLLAPGFHTVAYPLPHRRQFNLAMFAKLPLNHTKTENAPSSPILPRQWRQSGRIDAIMRAAKGLWGFWPLYTVQTPIWSRGAIGILGDAAHAMEPFQAQGAAMAIEDAAVLAPLLMTEADANTAFRRFEAMRRDRVTHVARTSHRNGTLFHLPEPLSFGRDLVLALQGRNGHLKRLDWLYDYKINPETGAPTAVIAHP